MSNTFDQCKNILTIDDLFAVNEGLSKVASKITGHDYEILPIDESDLARTDASSPEQDSDGVQCRENRIREKHEQASGTATTDDTFAAELNKSDVINALRQIKIDSDFMDISRAEMDLSENNVYHLSPIFNYDDVDIDSFDCVSIKISDLESDIFMQYFKRLGIFDKAQNMATTDNGQSSEPVESMTIPIKLYVANGELVLKANLSQVRLSDLQRMNNLSNIRSMLSLIPGKTHAR